MTKEDLGFINFMKTFEKALGIMNEKISNGQQHEELTDQENAFIEAIHSLFWEGRVTFDKRNMDASKLKVH